MKVPVWIAMMTVWVAIPIGNWAQTAAPPQSPEPAAKAEPAPPSPEPVTAEERALLRQAMLPDLRKELARIGEGPGADTPEGAWDECAVRAIRLGVLGRVLVVEWNPAGAPNASLINLYVLQDGHPRRIASDCCSGPDVLTGPRDIPDIVFGDTGGVCQEQYSRSRYKNGQYQQDACDRMAEGKGGSCVVTPCKGKEPTFPNPYPNQ